MKIYCLSGLGADHRVFDLMNINAEMIHIPWKKPLKNESPKEYMKRISARFNFEEPFYLLGLSFGGMMMHEILKMHQPEGVILFSTAKTRKDIPFYWRWLLCSQLMNLLPTNLFRMSPPFIASIFGVQRQVEKRMLKNIIKETDPYFVKWALNVIRIWSPNELNGKLLRIHGSKDRLIKVNRGEGVNILNGGHLVIRSRAKAASKLINDFIEA